MKWVISLGVDKAYYRGGILYRGCDTMGATTALVVAKEFSCRTLGRYIGA